VNPAPSRDLDRRTTQVRMAVRLLQRLHVIPDDKCDSCPGCIALLTNGRRNAIDVLIERAFGEFVEMPGLRLTLAQAKRLWGLDEPTCVRVLERLVEFGFLCRTSCDYARASDGRIACPRARAEEER
jgi:hypothetical protein